MLRSFINGHADSVRQLCQIRRKIGDARQHDVNRWHLGRVAHVGCRRWHDCVNVEHGEHLLMKMRTHVQCVCLSLSSPVHVCYMGMYHLA